MRKGKYAIFIDGSNVYATAKALGIDIDYSKLLNVFGDGLLHASYYTAMLERSDKDNPLIPLIDWLSYNGYSMVTKPTKEFTDAQGRRKIKGNMDIEIAVDALEAARHIDHAIFFTGDGDFRCLVDAMHRAGVRVTVVSSLTTTPPMVADELRRACDTFIELGDLDIKLEKSRSRYG